MAEAQKFNFELVSPEKVLMSEPAWQVVIPGEEGYFGVRAGHMSLIAAIKPGVVEVYKAEGAAPEKIFIAGGFADVTATNCSVLAEQAVNVNEINAADVQKDIANLKDELNLATDAADKAVIQNKIAMATLKLQAVQPSAAAH
jgi:F-type H+-transporting ATPase subunit epsilon